MIIASIVGITIAIGRDNTSPPSARSGSRAAGAITEDTGNGLNPGGSAPSVPSVDPEKFKYRQSGISGLYFSTPSGLWSCVILPATGEDPKANSHQGFAGCAPAESVGGNGAIEVPGVPMIPGHYQGLPTKPNTILVRPNTGAAFADIGQGILWRHDGITNVLEYGQTISGGGFSCNVQESGVSCQIDSNGLGFTISTHGFKLSPTPITTSVAPSAAVPVLGSSQGQYSAGFGEVRPKVITSNSLCANVITDVTWETWGDNQAQGHGSRCISAGATDQRPQHVVIIAADLGDCHGRSAYRQLTVYNAESGQTFESSTHQQICGS